MPGIICRQCGTETADLAAKCRTCGAALREQPTPTAVNCVQCGKSMERTTRARRDMTLQVLGVAVFFAGVWALSLGPLGAFVGVPLMIISARMGYSKQPIWLCRACGYFFERAK